MSVRLTLLSSSLLVSGCLALKDPPLSVDRTEALLANDDFIEVAVANQAACAITSDELIACFGRDTGNEGIIDVPDVGFTTVAGSSGAQVLFCGATSKGKLRCWSRRKGGRNPVKQTPSEEQEWQQVTVGDRHACAIGEDSRVVCWGDDDQGQLAVPEATFSEIEAAADHTCGMTTTNTALCWGGGDPAPAFLDYVHGTNPRNLTVGEDFICSSTIAGYDSTVDCYVEEGDGFWGVPAIASLVDMDAGNSHFCALTSDGDLSCYGANDHDQLEVPSSTADWIAVSSGYEGSCAVNDDGQIRCWGLMPGPQRAGY